MTIFETLGNRQKVSLQDAQDKLTTKDLDELEYGDELELNSDYCVYHYSEDDIVVINLKESWDEVLQVMWDSDSGEITFEAL